MLKFSWPLLAATVAGFAGFVSVGVSQAAVVVESGTYGPALTDWSGVGPLSTAGLISLGKFDSSLGTLTGVHVAVSDSLTGSLSITGLDAFDNTLTTVSDVNVDSQLIVVDPFNAGGSCTNTAVSCHTITGAVATIVTLTGGNDYTSNIVNTGLTGSASSGDAYSSGFIGFNTFAATATSSNGSLSGSAYLADFTGPGDVTFYLGTSTSLDGTFSSGSYQLNQTTDGTATLTVTYDYTPAVTDVTAAPEPASMAMLGFGLAALGMKRRRKA